MKINETFISLPSSPGADAVLASAGEMPDSVIVSTGQSPISISVVLRSNTGTEFYLVKNRRLDSGQSARLRIPPITVPANWQMLGRSTGAALWSCRQQTLNLSGAAPQISVRQYDVPPSLRGAAGGPGGTGGEGTPTAIFSTSSTDTWRIVSIAGTVRGAMPGRLELIYRDRSGPGGAVNDRPLIPPTIIPAYGSFRLTPGPVLGPVTSILARCDVACSLTAYGVKTS